jgi:hypothetical protein
VLQLLQRDLQHLWQLKIRSSKQLWQRGLQHFWAHPLSQPQLGAAAAQVGAASQPQAGAAAAQLLQPLLQPVLHFGLQQRWKLNKGLWQRPQPLLQPPLQPPLSQPQLGAAASQPQAGPAGAAQVGASQQLFLAQQLDSQQPPPTPSIRSSSSKPKL